MEHEAGKKGLDYYKKNASDMMFADYQYILRSCEDADGNKIATSNDSAERFAMTSLIRNVECINQTFWQKEGFLIRKVGMIKEGEAAWQSRTY